MRAIETGGVGDVSKEMDGGCYIFVQRPDGIGDSEGGGRLLQLFKTEIQLVHSLRSRQTKSSGPWPALSGRCTCVLARRLHIHAHR